MKKDVPKIFGYLEYQLCLTGGDPVMPVPVPVSSMEEAKKMMEIKIGQNTKSVTHSGFRVLSPDKKQVIHDYSATETPKKVANQKRERAVLPSDQVRKKGPTI